MMINCPNCNLLQPKDQYCARCGINIETWRPPEPPAWKKILGNWMVQLALLFALIFVLVLKDSFSGKPDRSYQKNNLPVANKIARSESEDFRASQTQARTQVEQPKKKPVYEKLGLQKGKTLSVKMEDASNPTLEKVATLKVTRMNRDLIELFMEQGQKLDENSVLLPRKVFSSIARKNRQKRNSVGASQSRFEFEKEAQMFVGEEDLETGLKLGFIIQINVSPESSNTNLQYEVIHWNQLQLNGEQGPRASLDVSAPRDSILLIVDPSPRDIRFNSDERSLFDSSDRLSKLNSEGYQEGQNDIVLVLRIK